MVTKTRNRIAIGVALILVLGLAFAPVHAQTFSAQIAAFWTQLRTGVLVFTNLRATGGTITGITISSPSVRVADGTLCSAPSIAFTSQPALGFAREGTNSLVVCIAGFSYFDWSGTSVKMAADSTLNWSTTAANATAATDITMRRSAAKTLTIDTDGAGGALTNVNVQGPLTSSAALIASTSVNANATSGFTLVGSAAIFATASKLTQITDSGGTTGTEINNGTPTLGTCTAGALTSGSHNNAGEYTGNTSSSCIINFGTPNWTNTPWCFAMSEASTTHPRISAKSVSSITIAGGVSGEAIQYWCTGRIGT